jgi:hypothetical protein
MSLKGTFPHFELPIPALQKFTGTILDRERIGRFNIAIDNFPVA